MSKLAATVARLRRSRRADGALGWWDYVGSFGDDFFGDDAGDA